LYYVLLHVLYHYNIKIVGGIYQLEGHNQPFKKAFLGFKGSHPHICMLYWNMVITILHIDLSAILDPLELVEI